MMRARHFLQQQLTAFSFWPQLCAILGWNGARAGEDLSSSGSIQQARLSHVISSSQAQGGALFVAESKETRLVLHEGLSSDLLDRLAHSVGTGNGEPGFWFAKVSRGRTFHFYLQTRECPQFLEKLIAKYLVVWSELYG